MALHKGFLRYQISWNSLTYLNYLINFRSRKKVNLNLLFILPCDKINNMEEVIEIKIQPMQRSEVDEVLKIEEQAYGEHHWSKDSFYGELSNNLAHYYSAFYKWFKFF